MASHPCIASTCRVCSTGRTCAATARWIADEIRTEDTAAIADAHRTRMWSERPPRDFGYFDVDDPYPLRQDPAFDPS
jgi:hypothetical protein